MSRGKDWCITWNNKSLEEFTERISNDDKDLMQYYIAQVRVPLSRASALRAPIVCSLQDEEAETGTRHIQAFVQFLKPQRLTTLQRIWPGLHAEVRRGTQQEASDYCTPGGTEKSGRKKEFGNTTWGVLKINAPGKRTDYSGFVRMAKEGFSDLEILEKYPGLWMKHQHMIQKIKAKYRFEQQQQTRTDEGVEVYIYWGPTGTGKTRKVVEENEDLWSSIPGTTKWFDGYEGQTAALFDDFNSDIPIEKMLRICDRYAVQVQVKGSTVQWIPTKIFITSNINPADWWMDAQPEHKAAFKRRVKQVVHFDRMAAIGGVGGIVRTRGGFGSYAAGERT